MFLKKYSIGQIGHRSSSLPSHDGAGETKKGISSQKVDKIISISHGSHNTLFVASYIKLCNSH